jgi:hypothetical protein
MEPSSWKKEDSSVVPGSDEESEDTKMPGEQVGLSW